MQSDQAVPASVVRVLVLINIFFKVDLLLQFLAGVCRPSVSVYVRLSLTFFFKVDLLLELLDLNQTWYA